MLYIIDTCNVGVKPEPNGGVVLAFTDIEGGIFDKATILVPLEGRETAKAFVNGCIEVMPAGIMTADLTEMRKETARAAQRSTD